jgi:hypothetical protein
MSKHFHRYKLLLDEGFYLPKHLPALASRHDVKHILLHFKSNRVITDTDVYKIACKYQRILITFNLKDFRWRAGSNKNSGVVGVSQTMTPAEIDSKLVSLLSKSKPSDLYSKYCLIKGSPRKR